MTQNYRDYILIKSLDQLYAIAEEIAINNLHISIYEAGDRYCLTVLRYDCTNMQVTPTLTQVLLYHNVKLTHVQYNILSILLNLYD